MEGLPDTPLWPGTPADVTSDGQLALDVSEVASWAWRLTINLLAHRAGRRRPAPGLGSRAIDDTRTDDSQAGDGAANATPSQLVRLQ
jgi:hypothetical protein